MSASRRRLRVVSLLAAAVLVAVAGCASIPQSGPVKAGPAQGHTDDQQTYDYSPGGPKRGSIPADIVFGFLNAMTATPLNLSVARQFLTTESSSSWEPERRTIVYGTQVMTPHATDVSVRLRSTTQLDGRGEWLGDPTHGHGLNYRLHLVRERGEWRISNPPNALIVPQSHFDTRFQQYYLYYFDQSAQVLVPEPVYLPSGPQAPTLLVAGLLRGPDPGLRNVERTFIPSRTQLGDISVPVSHDGVADVPLSNDVLHLRDEDLNLAFAQLAWTLAQVPGIQRMRITVDGTPIDLPGHSSNVSVHGWSEYDPGVAWATQSLFGLRGGRAVTVNDGREQRVTGSFGTTDFGLRSLASNLPGDRLAGVTSDGRQVLVSDRSQPIGGSADDATTAYSGGADVLRPVWDLNGQLWILDRTRHGARLSVFWKGELHQVSAPGIDGQDVRSFVVSRDGTRLVADLDHHGVDRLVIARIQRERSGGLRRVSPAQRLPLGGFQVDRIRDLAWRSPGSVAVLTSPTPDTSQVIVVRVDGSSAQGEVTTDPELFQDAADTLVTSPAPGSPLYIGTSSGRLFQLAGNGRWTGTGIRPGLGAPTFAG
jgi:hypothetical protein